MLCGDRQPKIWWLSSTQPNFYIATPPKGYKIKATELIAYFIVYQVIINNQSKMGAENQ